METRKNIDLSAIRARLEATQGQEYWRSLDQLAQTEEFAAMVQREFPEQAAELKDPVSRRNFLKLMSASLALGGLSSCTIQPSEKIVPQVRAPENVIPGKPQYFASAASLGGIGMGILVESHMGRPTKIEGNRRASLRQQRLQCARTGFDSRPLRPRSLANSQKRRSHQRLEHLLS